MCTPLAAAAAAAACAWEDFLRLPPDELLPPPLLLLELVGAEVGVDWAKFCAALADVEGLA